MSEVKSFKAFGVDVVYLSNYEHLFGRYNKQAQEIERLNAVALAYADAGIASNELGIAGMTAGDTIRMLGAELSQLKSRQSGVVLPEREQYTKYLAGVIPVNAVEAAAYKDGWNACLDEVDSLNSSAVSAGEPFQSRVMPWLLGCFGETIAGDVVERNHRFLEEALELVQACGCPAVDAHKLVEYVYGRKIGEKVQEVGGVMVTLAALCLAQGLDMHDAGEVELDRINQPDMVERIREKQKRKPAMSPLPGSYPARSIAPPAIPATQVLVERELRPVLAMILNALDRDAAEGKAARGEMAEELRAILSSKGDV